LILAIHITANIVMISKASTQKTMITPRKVTVGLFSISWVVEV